MTLPLDAHRLATDVTSAALVYALHTDAALEDVMGVVDTGPPLAVVDALCSAYLRLAQCRAALDGTQIPEDEQLLVMALDRDDGAVIDRVLALDPADPEAIGLEVDRLAASCEAFRASLPVSLPSMRTPSGFFPSVRAARELTGLRAALGLPPLEWDLQI